VKTEQIGLQTIGLEELIHANKEFAFKKIYDAYSKSLYGHAYLILKDKEAAEEVVQESFIKIWKNLTQYSSVRGTIFTWMFQILRNTAIDYIRKNKKHTEKKSEITENNVSDFVSQIEIRDSGLLSEIDKLSDNQKFIIFKLIFEGYTHQDLADEYNIPLGTVKSRFRLAIQNLREKLSGEDFLLLLLLLSGRI
jgi:RNA polymerase sigma factor (sigma-70 family)